MSDLPQQFRDAEQLAEAVVRKVGPRIVLGLPLGLGKANHIANALYRRAEADRTIDLKIFTALTLEKPVATSTLEARFIGPINQRLFGNYPDLLYAKALRAKALPPNIEVNEFFFLAGQWLSVAAAQQSYVSANYTHAVAYLLARGMNVAAQLVAKRMTGQTPRYSLSCNTDITLDLLKARDTGRGDFLLVGEVNSELPFMPGDGDLPADAFSHILENSELDFPLFAAPKRPITSTEYAIGFHVARLIPDGGTLQLGIGQEADAAAHALILRHHDNKAFCDVMERLTPQRTPSPLDDNKPFEKGLYGVSEMFVDVFLDLARAGVLSRKVDGALLHGAFFLGPRSFYRALRQMDDATISQFQMKAISFTNELYGDEDTKKRHRVGARFVNNAMMATLLGSVVSDGYEDGRMVSGVGGQFNFANQAFALDDARSVITLKATRSAKGQVASNIRWNYGHETIPRHLRDIVVTEYGVADLRGKSDQEVIAAMLSVADSRFQSELLKKAKQAGKIDARYEIPAACRENTPSRIAQALGPFQESGLLPRLPFGTDFTEVEQRLFPALEKLKAVEHSPLRLLRVAMKGLFSGPLSPQENESLKRLQLDRPSSIADRIYKLLIRGMLR
jgi:Acetyl-CoA hydrolase/transferase C-terminal domain